MTLRVRGTFDRQASEQCIGAYERVPCAWRKQLIVILEALDKVEERALETLLYFCERSLNPHRELHLVRCDPLVAQVLRRAGLEAYYHIREEPLNYYGVRLKRLPVQLERVRRIGQGG
jgi:anti-anti-sigma regulatory factor